ncbi:hypothetical protein BDF19DRAFT_434003 [Syncephalis fuscata]|nr:hypothetical protein BDF19DRAFT_434003 [Syncephalis fuscata]
MKLFAIAVYTVALLLIATTTNASLSRLRRRLPLNQAQGSYTPNESGNAVKSSSGHSVQNQPNVEAWSVQSQPKQAQEDTANQPGQKQLYRSAGPIQFQPNQAQANQVAPNGKGIGAWPV